MSCKKAQQFFEQKGIETEEVVDARKNTLQREGLLQLLSQVQTVFIGKGKKVLEFDTGTANEEEILAAGLGRTGNLRAPAIQSGLRLFIGYNDAMYEQL